MKKYFLFLSLLFCASFMTAQTPETLTNETIIKMVQAGVPSPTIIRTIAASDRVAFTFLPGDLAAIAQARVPDDVFKAMAAKSAGHPTPGLANAPATPPQGSLPPQQRTAPAPARTTTPNPQILVTETRGQTRDRTGNQGQSDSSDYQNKGMWDLNLSATGFIPHSSPSDAFGLVEVGSGYFVTRGSLIGAQVSTFFDQYGQDVFLSGGYEYFFKTGSPRFFPYVGGSAGGNILHSGGSTNGNFLAQADAGIRYFVAHHVAIELNYSLDWVHISGAGFTDSSFSVVSFGFVHTFGGGR